MTSTTSLTICLVLFMTFYLSLSLTFDSTDVQAFDQEDFRKTCPKCKQLPVLVRVRRNDNTNSMIATLAAEFVARGGLQSVTALMNSNDKMATLKQILGNQVTGAVLGNGILSRLVGQYRSGGGGGGGQAYVPPSPTGSGRNQPTEGDGRWDPAPAGGTSKATGRATGGAANPDDTEY